MPLDAQVLKNNLLTNIFNSPGYDPIADFPDDISKATETARRWAVSYAGYASSAQSCGGVINASVMSVQQAAMQAALVPFFLPPQVIPSTASGIIAALNVFWANPLMWLPIPPALPATLVVPAGAAAAIVALQAAWIANIPLSPTAAFCAAQLAGILDAYTKLVTVTHLLPPPVPPCVTPIL